MVDQIKKLSKEGKISKNPILIIGGVEYVEKFEIDLRETGISKADIKNIEVLKERGSYKSIWRNWKMRSYIDYHKIK